MPKASTKISASRRRKPSSRRVRYEDPLVRIHKTRRRMEAEKKRLGLTEAEYMDYCRRKNADLYRKLGWDPDGGGAPTP